MLTKVMTVVAAGAIVATAVVGWRFAIFILPFHWSGELERLVSVLHVTPGQTVADIGAGDGALAVAMAGQVGSEGMVYATELSAERRDAIAGRVLASGRTNVRVVAAAARETNLPKACCDAIYLRTVFHHVEDKPAFARALAEAVGRGGRLAIIDFAPGALWLHGDDHGVSPAVVIEALQSAGFTLVEQVADWGGGTYALVFERSV